MILWDCLSFPEKYINHLINCNRLCYYEPKKNGDGVYFGYGKINHPPRKDQREPGFFVEISIKTILKPAPLKYEDGG